MKFRAASMVVAAAVIFQAGSALAGSPALQTAEFAGAYTYGEISPSVTQSFFRTPGSSVAVSATVVSPYWPPGAAALTDILTSSLTPSPSIFANSVATQLESGYAIPYNGIGGAIVYELEISGPSSTVSVDISATVGYSVSKLHTELSASASFLVSTTSLYINPSYSGDLVFDSLGRANSGTIVSLSDNYSPGSSVASDNKSKTFVQTLLTNQIYYVELSAVTLDSDSTGSVSAFVDPTFNIDASVGNSSQYAFSFSNGVGNSIIATGVPELSSWIMLLIGFAGLGSVGYRNAKCEKRGISIN